MKLRLLAPILMVSLALAPLASANPHIRDLPTFYEELFDYKEQYLNWWAQQSSSRQNDIRSTWWKDPSNHGFENVIEIREPVYFPALALDCGGDTRNTHDFFPWFWTTNSRSMEIDLLDARAETLRSELAPGDPLLPMLDGLLAQPGSTSEQRMALWCRLVEYGEIVRDAGRVAIAEGFAADGSQGPIAAEWDAFAGQIEQTRNALESHRTALLNGMETGEPPNPPFALGAFETEAAALSLRGQGVEELVFAQRTPAKGFHWYESFGYWADRYSDNLSQWNIQTEGRLVRLDLSSMNETVLAADPDGSFRDPCVSFDGQKILFSHRPSGDFHTHLYEINAGGGSMRRLTDGPDDDIEPAYLPNGDIVFCSSRARRWVPCLNAQVAILHRCDSDGENIRSLTANVETENTPYVMPDGRLLFTRWEYVERDRGVPHGLWTSHPDGSGVMTFWGNMNEADVFIDAKPIPGTNEVLFIRHPHGSGDHVGTVAVLNPDDGPDEKRAVRNVTPDTDLDRVRGWRDPFPIAPGLYLACQHDRLYVMNDNGDTLLLHSVPNGWVHEPRPITAVEPPPDLTPRMRPTSETGRMVLADVTIGRRMDGVQRGEVDHLLLLEILPKPVHHDGHTENLSYNGNFFLERILGTVPVEDDGSAFFEVPALRNIFMVAMDEDGNAVKRMQSFVTVQPGETVSCVGCHESRTLAPPGTKPLTALTRPPSRIAKPAGIPEIFHFPRDIQPILNRNCLPCHDQENRDGDVVLSDELDPWFNQAYLTIKTRRLMESSFGGVGNWGNLPPRSVGAGVSRLYQLMREGHEGVSLSQHELNLVYYWIESWGQYSGTFAFLNKEANIRNPVSHSLLQNRCGSCHGNGRSELFRQGVDGGPTRADMRETFGLRVNLSDPRESLLLRAPLAESAGGLGICRDRRPINLWAARGDDGENFPLDRSDPPANVFTSQSDADFQQMLREIEAFAAENLARQRMERDNPLPHSVWVQEMIRNGLLPEDFEPSGNDLEFYFSIDEAYYQSFWWKPEREAGAPVAEAGPDRQVIDHSAAGFASVRLDGSASTDPGGSIVRYEWIWPGGAAEGPMPIAVFPLGTSVATLTVTDDSGATDTDTVLVTVLEPPPVYLAEESFNAGLNGWSAPPDRASSHWSAASGALRFDANQGAPARILARNGAEDWCDYQVTISITPGDDDPIGFLFYYQDSNNHLGFFMTNDFDGGERAVLFKMVNGERSILDSMPFTFVEGRTYHLTLDVYNGGMTTLTDGASLNLQAPTPAELDCGSVACYNEWHEGGTWDNITIDRDRDRDFMIDGWERQHFASLDRNGLGDWDHDGHTDRFEALAGADPTSNASRFFVCLEPSMKLRWSPHLESRRYRVLWSRDLRAETWNAMEVIPVIQNGAAEITLPGINQAPFNANGPVFFRLEITE